MTIELRPITNDEYVAFHTAAASAFGDSPTTEEIEETRSIFEFDRSLAAFDSGRIVGNGILISFELTLPGAMTAPAGGVSWIGVLPTHRRRGILSSIMRQQFRDMRERGEILGILWASESIIYGRFGYGVATHEYKLEIDPRHGAFARTPEITGRLEFIDKEAARTLLPELWNRYRQLQPGELTRNDKYWTLVFRDREAHRDGASAYFYVAHRAESGEIDGCVTYRVKSNWDGGFPQNALRLRSLVSTSPEARAALWQFLLHVDLVATITGYGSVDEPLRWMLADSRRLRMTGPSDGLWVRLVDIPAALTSRRYQSSDRLVINVTDPFCPENDGNYRLEGAPEGATCKRSKAGKVDIALQITDLGAVYLGGVRFSTLARAGRIEECTRGALRRADVMFASDPAPLCQTGF